MLPFGLPRAGSTAGLSGPAASPPSSPSSLPGSPANKPADPHLKECGYYDVQRVQEVCRSLLYALGAASVEKTTGGILSHPCTVVDEMKRLLNDHVQSQVDAYATSSTGSHSQSDPVKVIQEILEKFVKSKRSIFRRVSNRILFSEKEEDRIEEFVIALEKEGSWALRHREALAKAYLRRVDRSKTYHCEMKFPSSEQLAQHKRRCPLRPLMCENSNCGEVVAAMNARAHDEACMLKLLPCQQKCEALVLRGDMSDHCTTVCPMKQVDCPFNEVGCKETLPQAMAEEHCAQFTGVHLSLILQALQKQEVFLGKQAESIASLEKALSYAQISETLRR